MSDDAGAQPLPPLEPLPGLLVSPSWLTGRLGQPGLRLVDLRDAEAFAAGHIPGSTSLQLADLGTSIGGVDNVLLPADRFSALMSAHGISSTDRVVAYDDQWGLAAARLVWALRRYGHDDAAVLNGGWDGWLEADGPTATESQPIAAGTFRAGGNAAVLADADWITERLGSQDLVLLDTRSPAEFDRGHLPGAVSWDWINAVPVGEWEVSRNPAELRDEWREMGFDRSSEVAVYCRSGMRAAHTWLVLRAAGFERVRLYDGSWQDWSMREIQQSDD